MSTKKDVMVNPLLTREVRPALNLKEFFERWEASRDFDEMLGRLHRGFNVPLERAYQGKDEYIDFLTFYFSIADGWTYEDNLRSPADEEKRYRTGWEKRGNIEWKTPSEFRQMLARKAFDMLCQNFFKSKSMVGSHDSEQEMEIILKLLPLIQNFFRAEKQRFGENIVIRNIAARFDRRSPGEEYAINFLLKLANFIWEWQELEVPSWSSNKEAEERQNVELRSLLDSTKPWMVEVLSCLDRLDILRKWLLALDRPCLAKLKEIAMRNELRVDRYLFRSRPVATIDEACYIGSKAAWLLKEYELKKSEHQRLMAIHAAQLKKMEAEQELKKLS